MSKALPVTVEFAGTVLEGIVKGGVAYVALRPIVEGMGLDWKGQFDKIKADEVLGPTVGDIPMVAADGKKRLMTCLPEEYLQGWLFKINSKKVKPEVHDAVVRYQRECYRVLHRAFTQGVAETNLRILAIDSKRAMGRLMADVTKDVLVLAGKEPKAYHFSNEHRLVNWALTGEFGAVEEAGLSADQLAMLAELRRRNAVLIGRGLDYKARKPMIEQYAADWRSERMALAA